MKLANYPEINQIEPEYHMTIKQKKTSYNKKLLWMALFDQPKKFQGIHPKLNGT